MEEIIQALGRVKSCLEELDKPAPIHGGSLWLEVRYKDLRAARIGLMQALKEKNYLTDKLLN